MTLQEMLGDAYKEGMTAEELSSVFEKRFVDSGKYVEAGNQDSLNNDLKTKDEEIKKLKKQLKDKMTDGEKTDTEKQELLDKIQELEELNIANKKSMSKASVEGSLNALKSKIGVKDNDKEFNELIENLSSEDTEKSKKTGNYIAKIINDAYEKGKAEATKTNLGKMGEMVIGEDGKLVDKEKQFVDSLLEVNKPKVYEKSNFI